MTATTPTAGLLAALALGAMILLSASPAEAFFGRFVGGAIVGGMVGTAIGAAVAQPRYYYPPAYYRCR